MGTPYILLKTLFNIVEARIKTLSNFDVCVVHNEVQIDQ